MTIFCLPHKETKDLEKETGQHAVLAWSALRIFFVSRLERLEAAEVMSHPQPGSTHSFALAADTPIIHRWASTVKKVYKNLEL
jgi:hypothetical protein